MPEPTESKPAESKPAASNNTASKPAESNPAQIKPVEAVANNGLLDFIMNAVQGRIMQFPRK